MNNGLTGFEKPDIQAPKNWVRRDRVDGTLLEECREGVVTRHHDFVEVCPADVVERATGIADHVPGFKTIEFCKPENRAALERMIVDAFNPLRFE